MTQEDLFAAVSAEVKRVLGNVPACHDYDHTLRVLANTELLIREEKPSGDVAFAARIAALLHDIARPEEAASGGKVCHAAAGGPKAEKILRETGCSDENLIRLVRDAIMRHRFRGTARPVTMVDRLVHDADKLDSIGAVGIARAYHFAGHQGSKLHNTQEEALHSEEFGRDDTAYREYLVKLRHVPGRMLTETGKRLAQERSDYMDEFFRRMNIGW